MYKLFLFFLSNAASPQTFYLLFVNYLCQSISQPDSFLSEVPVFCYRGFLLPCSRDLPHGGFSALPDYFTSHHWQPFKLLWMKVSSCRLLPLRQSQLFNTRKVWGETKCKGWHFWRKDLHFVSSSIQCDVRVRMRQWL